jgi:hypothetical protein
MMGVGHDQSDFTEVAGRSRARSTWHISLRGNGTWRIALSDSITDDRDDEPLTIVAGASLHRAKSAANGQPATG